MTPSQEPSTHAGFQTTLDRFSMGVELMRQNLRRADPEASADEIDRRLHDWLQERPGAEFGDCTGRRLDLIATRGYSRGKDLAAEMDRWTRSSAT